MSTGGEYKENAENKKEVIVPPSRNRITLTLSSGFESRYMYHGLDLISFDSANIRPTAAGFVTKTESSAIAYVNAHATYRGLSFGVGYTEAISGTVPFIAAFDRGNFKQRHYDEVQIPLDYTFTIIGGFLESTVGYNSYILPIRDFRGTNYIGEVPIHLTYTQLHWGDAYIHPSFVFYRYISDAKGVTNGNLNGNYTEFRLDGAFPVYKTPEISVTLAPYAVAGYNIDFLRYTHLDSSGNVTTDVGGWNEAEVGLQVPIRIGQHISVTPYGNYGWDISDSTTNGAINNLSGNGFGERTHFWGGLSVAYTF